MDKIQKRSDFRRYLLLITEILSGMGTFEFTTTTSCRGCGTNYTIVDQRRSKHPEEIVQRLVRVVPIGHVEVVDITEGKEMYLQALLKKGRRHFVEQQSATPTHVEHLSWHMLKVPCPRDEREFSEAVDSRREKMKRKNRTTRSGALLVMEIVRSRSDLVMAPWEKT